MQFLLFCAFSLLIAVLDQIVKLLTAAYIPLGGHASFIPGVLGLTYVQNTGAAFSTLQGQQWLFALVFLVLSVLLVWEYFRKPMPFSKFERWCIAAIYGGGLGNMLDRLRLGYVVDMLETEFMEFPVFNVADCFITCGCIALMVSLVFFNRGFWKDEAK